MQAIKLFFFIVLVFTAELFAIEKQEKTVQIIADRIEQNGSLISAHKNVLIFSPNYYITAGKAIYDRNNSTIELFDKVSVIKDDTQTLISKYAFLDLKKEIDSITPILLLDKKSKIWINAKKIEKNKDYNEITDATLSSCECENPAWSIGFSSGDFNQSKEWINTYNNTVYIKNIPAWYFLIPAAPFISTPNLIMGALLVKSPYFGFPTSKKRGSGLLIPKLGYSQKEGWFYMQPIYYAPSESYDFEYIPQIRERRGYGHELIFRLADSPYSKLTIDGGRFYENKTYFEEENLINRYHEGWSVEYDRSKLFTSDSDSSDGLYIKYHDMSDVEYATTKYNYNDDGITTTIDKLLHSQAKYYYNNQYFHFNMGSDYYNDITKVNNKETTQVIPFSQIHQYSQNLFFEKLRFSADVKQTRNTRDEGIAADVIDITVPVSYSQYFFNKFLLAGIEKSMIISKIEYKNNTNNYKDGLLMRSNDSIYFDIDLIKPYDAFFHTINFNTKFTKVNYHKTQGDLYGLTNNSADDLILFPYTKEQDNIDIALNQNFFGKETKKQYLSHKIRQKIIYDTNRTATLDNLENEIVVRFPYTTFSNKLLYNHDDDMVIESLYALRLAKGNHYLHADYSYSLDKNSDTNSYKDGESHKSVVGSIGTKVLKYYTLRYKEQYNITDHISTVKEYGLKIDHKCWALDFVLTDSLVASATDNNKAIRQDVIYVTYTLKPLVAFKQKYVQKEREE